MDWATDGGETPKDRRARAVVITPKGRRTVKRARALAQEVEDDVLQGLAPAERRHLAEAASTGALIAVAATTVERR